TAEQIEVLHHAARSAGLAPVELIAEPIAAARHIAATTNLAEGSYLAVYDLGGGTFDVAILQRQADGFTLVGKGGDNEIGGELFDDLIVAFLGESPLGENPAWAELSDGVSPGGRALREQVRIAKEALSDEAIRHYDIPIPVAGESFRLHRH